MMGHIGTFPGPLKSENQTERNGHRNGRWGSHDKKRRIQNLNEKLTKCTQSIWTTKSYKAEVLHEQ